MADDDAAQAPITDDAAVPGDERRPRSVYGVGGEPDARYSLANERTALAWVRTGLSLVAGGVALTSFATFADLSKVLDVIAGLSCLAGAALSVWALVGWARNERALRLGEPLPNPRALPVLVVFVVALGLALCVYAVFEAI